MKISVLSKIITISALLVSIILFTITIAIVFHGCDGTDDSTEYYSKWETCSVVDVVGNTATLECNGIYKYADNDGSYHPGDTVTARSDYVANLENTEIDEP